MSISQHLTKSAVVKSFLKLMLTAAASSLLLFTLFIALIYWEQTRLNTELLILSLDSKDKQEEKNTKLI